MLRDKLEIKKALQTAASLGWSAEANQNGIQRLMIGDVLIEPGGGYSWLSVSVPKPPTKVKKYRVIATVGEKKIDLGDFASSVEASVAIEEMGLPSTFTPEIAEVETEEVV